MAAAADFWRTLPGLLARLSDLAHHFTWSTVNTAVRESVAVVEAERPPGERRRIRWATMGDEKVCAVCGENEDEYSLDEPLPEMPAHVMCRCHWEIVE
jgi:hypothetical protein